MHGQASPPIRVLLRSSWPAALEEWLQMRLSQTPERLPKGQQHPSRGRGVTPAAGVAQEGVSQAAVRRGSSGALSSAVGRALSVYWFCSQGGLSLHITGARRAPSWHRQHSAFGLLWSRWYVCLPKQSSTVSDGREGGREGSAQAPAFVL